MEKNFLITQHEELTLEQLCLKLTIKTPEQYQWPSLGLFWCLYC